MRKKRAKKRYLTPDSKFNSQLATRFVKNIMLDGKKNIEWMDRTDDGFKEWTFGCGQSTAGLQRN